MTLPTDNFSSSSGAGSDLHVVVRVGGAVRAEHGPDPAAVREEGYEDLPRLAVVAHLLGAGQLRHGHGRGRLRRVPHHGAGGEEEPPGEAGGRGNGFWLRASRGQQDFAAETGKQGLDDADRAESLAFDHF